MKIETWLRRLSLASMLGMFLILVMGALVTKTESGRGCGDDWPLCNGKFVPAYTIESLIEYSHRFVVGIVGLVLLATTLLVFIYSQRKDAKWFVGGAMFFTVLQAILGAMTVVWPQNAPALALHFGFSLLAFAFTLLLYLVYTKWGEALLHREGTVLSPAAKLLVWVIMIYTYGVVYLGAYVHHTESSGGCIGWPLCNGEVIPDLSGATGIMFTHRVAAAVLGLLIAGLYFVIKAQAPAGSTAVAAARYAVVFVILQIFSGAFVTLSMGYDWYLLASLMHTVLISCLYGILSYLAILTLQPSESVNQAYAAP
ncbi:COX15/CtaA family protein [Paenibacillus silviterrae]|uniref:COX15/CtaA family protein n=1 Tax=Paenibacillus silviterrae TaxID=3242194 RepID=UPI0025438E46|nr:COX15/CtaA family protein [Paenibacillus chinjuensis]